MARFVIIFILSVVTNVLLCIILSKIGVLLLIVVSYDVIFKLPMNIINLRPHTLSYLCLQVAISGIIISHWILAKLLQHLYGGSINLFTSYTMVTIHVRKMCWFRGVLNKTDSTVRVLYCHNRDSLIYIAIILFYCLDLSITVGQVLIA